MVFFEAYMQARFVENRAKGNLQLDGGFCMARSETNSFIWFATNYFNFKLKPPLYVARNSDKQILLRILIVSLLHLSLS